eukprot:UN01081
MTARFPSIPVMNMREYRTIMNALNPVGNRKLLSVLLCVDCGTTVVKLYCGDSVVVKLCDCGCVVVVKLAHKPSGMLQDPVKLLEFMVCLCLFDLNISDYMKFDIFI